MEDGKLRWIGLNIFYNFRFVWQIKIQNKAAVIGVDYSAALDNQNVFFYKYPLLSK